MEKLGHSILQVAGIVFVLAATLDFTATLIDREFKKLIAIKQSYHQEQQIDGIALNTTAGDIDDRNDFIARKIKGGK